MSKSNSQPSQAAQAQSRRLSPEINEFMHMLSALEGQLADKPTTPAQR